ncbi:Synapsin, ATP binding domain containing protein [Histomonas meleagridis]|uniref:Synapsin, ATP binding domain containing protein n=1 Tax=Histomonas meleagridis TaxID=135588 RepID=UPI00355962F8|nr:Synapsin, ATP binding domain containing protein [Histomonas meleagridis]KAH0805724.1 Synapsin, ATP binding domain containing protein [Histomonas meleagridis]
MSKKIPTVLVIANPGENWYQLCADYTDVFTVEQACWEDISLTSYPNNAVVNLGIARFPNSENQKRRRTITPDLILIRMFCRYIGVLGTKPDYRNVLYGFMHANIPMINAFSSIVCDLDRPLMIGCLKSIEKRLGSDNFPVIPQYYYSEPREMFITPSIPYVLKVSYSHAGYGKTRINNSSELDDVKSILHLHHDYAMAEPFITSAYEVRIVFIAPDYYRAHKRTAMEWKVNYGMSNEREDIDMTPKYKMWIDEIRKAFPDMETFCIDSIVAEDGKEYILEVNGSAHGLAPEHNEEELIKMRELVMSKLNVLKEEEGKEHKATLESDKDLEILNLKNRETYLESLLQRLKQTPAQAPVERKGNTDNDGTSGIVLYFIAIILVVVAVVQFFLLRRHK